MTDLAASATSSIPYRFNVGPTTAAKWQRLSKETQDGMLVTFLNLPVTVRQQYSGNFGKRVSNAVTCFASCPAGVTVDFSYYDRQSFAQYVTGQVTSGANRSLTMVESELAIAAEWARLQGSVHTLEYSCSVGRVDILFTSRMEIVEAKTLTGWKHALGQVLAYQAVLGDHYSASLLLIPDGSQYDRSLIKKVCAKYNVTVYFYERPL